MAPADIHPGIAELEAFTLGTLDDASLAGVEAHVADCPTCQECAAGASGDTLVELLRRVHAQQARSNDTENATLAHTPAPVPAFAEAATLPPATPTETDGTEVIDVIPQELARHQRYRVLRLLGAGGMGAVYEAEHRVMQRAVAIKVINRAFTTNPAAVERFRREVRAAARLTHPNIVTTYDAEDAADSLFLVMEYAEGVSLARLVKERGRLTVAEACDCVRQAALGLQHAHERGMVHRDIKPDNLIRCVDGTVKVLDFGLAALTAERGDDSLTGTNVIMGTPDYLAPEQAEDARTADARSDVYSLGCTLYTLLTGAVPYPASTALFKILAHREQPVPSLRSARPGVPEGLPAVVARMLAKKPADRYQTAGEVAAALAPFSSNSGSGTRKAPRKPPRRWAVAVGLLFAGLIAAAGVVFSIKTDNGTIEIRTDDENVKIIAERNGKQVTVIDPKSKQSWVVDTGEWTVRLDGNPDGLKLEMPATFTLKRGDKQVVTIKRVKGTDPTAADEKVGEVRRIPWKGGGGRVFTTAISPDNRYYMAGGDPLTARLWDLKTGKQLHEFKGEQAYFTPDGKQVVTGTWTNSQFRVYDVVTGKEIRTFSGEGDLWAFQILPDGKHIASITGSKAIHVWDLVTGKELHTFTGETMKLQFLFSSDGKRFVYSIDGKPSRVLDLVTGKEVGAYENILARRVLYRFLPGDREIMGYRDETTLQFYEVASGKLLREVDLGKGANFIPASMSADGRRFLACYPDDTFRLWDLTTGKVLHRWAMIDGKNPKPAFISLDGRYASGISDNGSVYLWRLPEPSPVKDKP
jgi:serine/threonine protein kinase